jgi:hypothetical protein
MRVIGSEAERKAAAKSIAHKAAEKLFVNGYGDRATRLVLVDESNGEPGRDLGGLCEWAAKDVIARVIEEAFKAARSVADA